jgi:pilus assembly protein CpaB
MRFVAILVLCLGIALAGAATYMLREFYANQAMMAARPVGPETIRVLAAKKALNYGDRLDLAMAEERLRWVTWPKDAVPEGAFTSGEELLGPERAETRTVLRTIEPGELVLKSKVTGFGQTLRVAARVTEGKRAFTIPINAVSGVAGLIAPGDRVDILLTRSIDRDLVTSTILQNILVIATDQTANTETSATQVARTATVEVEPAEASKLALAQQVGSLSLSLRGMHEAFEASVGPVSVEDLPDQPAVLPPQPVPLPPPPNTVTVRKGTEVQEIELRQ